MSFQVNNNNYSRFYESHNNQFHNQSSLNSANARPSNDILASLFGFLSKFFASQSSGSNPGIDFLNQLFGNQNQTQQKQEDYGGFKFKNEGEKAKIDQALEELRAKQAENPGEAVSKKFKIGKYKYRVTLDENGETNIKRKKKKRGFFSKIGSAFKSIGNGIGKVAKKVGGFVKKALPIISTVAMFIPGLQPIAMAAKVASGVMGVVDGIKNGNVFGAVMSGVGALSGVGGKVGQFFGGLGSKASGFLGNASSNILGKMGTAGTWIKDMVGKGTGLVNSAKNWFSTFSGNMGTKVSDFILGKGGNLLGDLSKSFGGKLGQLITEKGPDLLNKFAASMGNKTTGWLHDQANNLLAKILDNPTSSKITNFLNSPLGQILAAMLRGKQA